MLSLRGDIPALPVDVHCTCLADEDEATVVSEEMSCKHTVHKLNVKDVNEAVEPHFLFIYWLRIGLPLVRNVTVCMQWQACHDNIEGI